MDSELAEDQRLVLCLVPKLVAPMRDLHVCVCVCVSVYTYDRERDLNTLSLNMYMCTMTCRRDGGEADREELETKR